MLLRGDVGNRAACETVARKAIETFGAIDLLVNNAAFQRSYDTLEAIPDAEFEEAYQVNVFAEGLPCGDTAQWVRGESGQRTINGWLSGAREACCSRGKFAGSVARTKICVHNLLPMTPHVPFPSGGVPVSYPAWLE
jgi:NAD(P)-dependent dehydrogenase (short-subunit alcohol dehydrogenase family)